MTRRTGNGRDRIKTSVLALALILAGALISSGLDVAEEEARAYDGSDIEYFNYLGPHAFFNTAEEIIGIGRDLDVLRRRDGRTGNLQGKYSVTRILPPGDGTAFGADVLSFERGALVDHIDNVRRIISGYLMQSFGYDAADAVSLAGSITLYNTHLAGRVDYVAARYSSDLLDVLRVGEFGLSRYYAEWAGAARIVIPLVSGVRPTAPAVGERPTVPPAAAGTPAPEPAVDRAPAPPAVATRPADAPPPAPSTAPPAPTPTTPPPVVDTRPPVAAAPPTVDREPVEERPADAVASPPAPAEEDPVRPAEPAAAPVAADPDGVVAAVPPTEREDIAPGDEGEDGVPAEAEPVVAVDEVVSPPPELVSPRMAEERPPRRPLIAPRLLLYLIVGLIAILLVAGIALILLRRPPQERSRSRPYIPMRTGGTALAAAAGRGAGIGRETPIVMRLIYRDFLLNRKHFVDLRARRPRSVGGKGAYYGIPYISLPKRIAEIRKRGDSIVFTPLKEEYFPNLQGPLSDFFGREIVVRSKDGETVILLFHKYVSPLEEVNRIMRSIQREDGDTGGPS